MEIDEISWNLRKISASRIRKGKTEFLCHWAPSIIRRTDIPSHLTNYIDNIRPAAMTLESTICARENYSTTMYRTKMHRSERMEGVALVRKLARRHLCRTAQGKDDDTLEQLIRMREARIKTRPLRPPPKRVGMVTRRMTKGQPAIPIRPADQREMVYIEWIPHWCNIDSMALRRKKVALSRC